MKKSAKSIITALLLLVMLISALSVSALATSNPNTEDAWFYASEDAYSVYTTEGREKYNDTPVYCYPTQSPNGYLYVQVGGSNYKNSGYNNVTTGTNYVRLTAGTKYVIHSYVNETGYTYARLKMYSQRTGAFSGWWSSDTTRGNIPYYTSAN